MTVADRIRPIIAESLGVPLGQVTDAAALIDDLGADWLDMFEIVMACEEACSVVIAAVAAGGVNTVGELIALVEKSHPEKETASG